VRLVAAEDARPEDGTELRVLTDATGSASALLRQAAVRALGRLERPQLVDRIAPLLDDGSPAVRAEAANAIAQAVHRVDGDAVMARLAQRVRIETDTVVVAALARSIGRTATSPSARARASDLLLEVSRRPRVDGSARALQGVALGWESLVRGAEGQGLGASAAARLTELAASGGDPLKATSACARSRIRRWAKPVESTGRS
jgi:HEAT repeat protein